MTATTSTGAALGFISCVFVAFSYVALVVLVLAPAAGAAPGSKGVVSWIGNQSSGELGGEFANPGGVAVNQGSGDIYVADSLNHRIQQFSSSGAFIRAWGFDVIQSGKPGDLGDGAFEICTLADDCKGGISSVSPAPGGELSEPQGVAIDQSDGSVYVWDQGFRRVQKFSATGEFQLAFGKDVDMGGGAGTEVCPTAATCQSGVSGSLGGELGSNSAAPQLAVAPVGVPNAGNVVVADPANRRVQEFSSSGVFVRTFGFDVAGEGAGGDNTGTGFEVCTQAVAGASNCKIGAASGPGVGQFANNQPRSVAVDTTGAIYAVESATNNRVQKFTPQVGPPALAPSAFAEAHLSGSPAPTHVTIDPSNDNVYVTKPASSPADRQVRQFDSSGALQFAHGVGSGLTQSSGVAVKSSDGPVYQSSGNRVFVLDNLTPPTADLDSPAIDGITPTSAMLHALVTPNGPPDVSYRFEYSLNGTSWTPVSIPDTPLGSQLTPQSVSQVLEPEPLGLEPNTTYHIRVVATRPFNADVASSSETFTTLAEAPIAETTGSPVRAATTAQLNGRFVAFNKATEYHFEYGLTEAYGQSTPSQAGGSGGTYQLVTEEVTGLKPSTTYHYRLVADNGAPGSPAFGEDMTVTTRASDTPLSHGGFPGPVGSDRAWELVSQPDTSGNPVFSAMAMSDDGNSAIYRVNGGAPHSESGSIGTQLFTERTSGGWRTKGIYPPRAEANATQWQEPTATEDLSAVVAVNYSATGEEPSAWRMFPDKPAEMIFSIPATEWASIAMSSEDGSRAAWVLLGSHDPNHPSPPGVQQLYDVSSGSPHLLSLMPDGSVPACGVPFGGAGYLAIIQETGRRNWISSDGSLAFFTSEGDCTGPLHVYARDIDAEVTHLLSGPPVSGVDCGGAFIKSTPDAAFFVTTTRLVAEDTQPSSCSANRDVYRYDLDDSSLQCVTCVVPGLDANVVGTTHRDIGVSEDGSGVYFQSSSRLVPGSVVNDAYHVDVSTGDLFYVGAQVRVGDEASQSNAISADGSVLIFKSDDLSLNALGGQDNGGTAQYYRYDVHDGSLTCVSCPQDGSPPLTAVRGARGGGLLASNMQLGQNTEPLDSDGNFIFVTPTALVSVDQNTSFDAPYTGHDVYEWRDGRLLLVSDGLTNWAENFEVEGPEPAGFTPSGRDAFFTAPAQYTVDALDGFRRLYDARIGGGIEFPPPPVPCPLEVCQGTPKGAPDDLPPSSLGFRGVGNLGSEPRSCVGAARQAKRLARGARRLAHRATALRRAARAGEAKGKRATRRRARRLAVRAKRRGAAAKRRSRAAKRCRAARRNANTDRRTAR